MDKTVEVVTVMECLQLIIPSAVSLLALAAAICIPCKIMVNQIYAGLIDSYRSPEMGAAILALFHFFVEECKEDTSVICKKYREKYEEQIGNHLNSGKELDFSNILHFQRRMVAQFYFHIANLRYKCCPPLSFRKMKMWFMPEDLKLLSIVLHLAEPAKNVFIKAGNIPEPPEDDVPMNKLIRRLYKEMKNWQEKRNKARHFV
jgi:hypothetical protein